MSSNFPMQRDYSLDITEPSPEGKVLVTSPQVPGLIIYALPEVALADVPAAVALLRRMNAHIFNADGTRVRT